MFQARVIAARAEKNFSAQSFLQAEQFFNQRELARAVFPDYAKIIARAYREIRILKDNSGAVTQRYFFTCQQNHFKTSRNTERFFFITDKYISPSIITLH